MSHVLVDRNFDPYVSDLNDMGEFSLVFRQNVQNATNCGLKKEIEKEIDLYLNDGVSDKIDDFSKIYPNIFQLFQKFNCIRSSEAICERLFSYAGKHYFLLGVCISSLKNLEKCVSIFDKKRCELMHSQYDSLFIVSVH